MPDQAKLTTLDQLEAELERLRSDAIGAGLWVLVPPIEEALKTLHRERLRPEGRQLGLLGGIGASALGTTSQAATPPRSALYSASRVGGLRYLSNTSLAPAARRSGVQAPGALDDFLKG